MLTWWEQDTELRTLNYVWLLLQTKRKEFILKWNLFNENYWGGGHLYHHTHVGIREQFIFYYKYFESPSIYCNSKWLVYHCIVGWIMSPKRYAEVTGHGICKWTLFGNIWAFENVLSWYHSGLGWSQIKDWCLSRPREGPYIPGRVICKDWVQNDVFSWVAQKPENQGGILSHTFWESMTLPIPWFWTLSFNIWRE